MRFGPSFGRLWEAVADRAGRLRLAGRGGPRRLQRMVDAAYREWAPCYDDDAWSNVTLILEQPLVPGLVAPGPDETVLDMGCGTGIHLAPLAAQARLATGCDRSLAMLRQAAGKPGAAAAALVAADARRPWPFADGSFHRVLAALLLSHLPDLVPFYAEASRVLAPGGLLVTDCLFWDVDGFEPRRPDLLTRWRRQGRTTYVDHPPLAHIRAANRAGLPLDRVEPLVLGREVRASLTPESYRRNRGRCIGLVLRFQKPSADAFE